MTEFKSPMLVSEVPGHQDRISEQEYVFIQPKLNGWCGMANTRTRRIYTRSGREITNLSHINAALPSDGPEWLHGEYYVHGMSLDEIAAMIKRGDGKVEFHVFDCVGNAEFRNRFYYYPIQDYLDAPIKHVRAFKIEPWDINIWYKQFLADGYEGLIIRLDGHGYEHKRSINVFKMKPTKDITKE